MTGKIFTLSIPVVFFMCAFSCSGIPDVERPLPAGESPLDAYYAGRVEEAAAGLETLLEEGPENPRRLKGQLAVLYRELGRGEEAQKLLEETLSDSAGDTAAVSRRELYIGYYLSGQYARAREFRNSGDMSAFTGLKDEREQGEMLFYDAMLSKEQGETERAITLFKESLKLNKWRPIAWYHLGLLLAPADPKEAETCLNNCLSQDSAFSEALFPLGKLLMERGAWYQAAELLARADQRLPGNRELRAALAEARKHVPARADELAPIRRKIGAKPPVVKNVAVPAEGTIRIGLAEGRTLVSVKAGGDFRIAPEGAPDGGEISYRGRALDQIWVSWERDGNITVQDENGKTAVRSARALILSYNDPENTSIVAGVVNGAPGVNRSYRGILEFRPAPGGMTVVNVLNMEEYLYGVVPAEMPVSWPEEALKAQAIAARSYGLAYKGHFADRGFDLYGTPHSMAYHGVGDEHKNTSAAVDATRGIILKGGEAPLRAYFSANHGGYSEDSLTMWGYDAYMAAVPDKRLPVRDSPLPPDELDRWIRETPPTFSFIPRLSYVSAYRWEKWVTPAEIARRLARNPGEITRITSRGRGVSGRIYALEVRSSKDSVMVEGDAIWNAMGGLRSSLFTIDTKRNGEGKIEYFIFRGAGYGHGIGLDQHGAAGMAGAGYKAEEILRHYYPRAELGAL
ncbi:MAG: SpoIID/LytB domain-containing protein [Treponema sp.]|nr:SpoIID/LytB domain-containing protein [Treponema sp.]